MKEPENNLLTVSQFGVAFVDKVILNQLDLVVKNKQTVCLMGPTGVGKSTLLRTLAGFNDTNPNMRCWGNVDFNSSQHPRMGQQSTRLLMASLQENLIHDYPHRGSLSAAEQQQQAQLWLEEACLGHLQPLLHQPVIKLPLVQQRLIAIIRLCQSDAPLILLDEPTTGLPDGDEQLILQYLQWQQSQRAFLVSLHNRKHALALGGDTALLSNGKIQERQPTSQFFNHPNSDCGQQFVKSGSCISVFPSTPQKCRSEKAAQLSPAPGVVSGSYGPRGFLWLLKGRLAGTPMPGIFFEQDYDLAALKRVGINQLISLMAEQQPDVQALKQFGIHSYWCPVKDMAAPSAAQAKRLCRRIDQQIAAGDRIAVHCRAGMGRTGTLLAAYLIWQGEDALSALEQVRCIEPRWVQSQQQIDFLEQFFHYLKPKPNNDSFITADQVRA